MPIARLRQEKAEPLADAIVFKCDFRSPSAELSEGTAWEPEAVYADCEWYIARTTGGAWQVVTCGY